MLGLAIFLGFVALMVGLYFAYDRRYRGRSSSGAQPTSEVFRDPTTGELTRVYENPATGHREYRPENSRQG